MEFQKTVIINKKAKYKTLDALFKISAKENYNFTFDGFDVEIYTDDGEFCCNHTHLGKEVEITSAKIEFDSRGQITSIEYYSKNNEFYESDKVFFSKFPKLTKAQLAPLEMPKMLKRGDGAPDYDMIFNVDKSLKVACQTLSAKQTLNTFKFLAEELGYDLED